jgi:hypothetical protein
MYWITQWDGPNKKKIKISIYCGRAMMYHDNFHIQKVDYSNAQ